MHEEQQGKLYHIRYPLVGWHGLHRRRHHAAGDHAGRRRRRREPDDERYTHLHGKMRALLPLSSDREIPIIADDWAKPEFGTGAVKVTPAHDPNDFAIGQRHEAAQPSTSWTRRRT